MISAFITLMIAFLVTIFLIAFMPYFTRKTELFGVSIPQSYHNRDDFKKLRKSYSLWTILIGFFILLAAVFTYFKANMETATIMITLLVFVFLLASFLIYLPYHFKLKAMKNEENWHETRRQKVIVNTGFRKEKLTISSLWYFMPGLIILFTLFYTFIMYNHIPSEIPMHTDFKGDVRYDPKSVKTLLYLPMTQVFILLIMLGVHFIIGKSKQQINAENPDESTIRNILYRRKSSVFLLWIAVITELLMTLIQFSFIHPNLDAYIDYFIIIFTVLILIMTFIYAIKVGQGGSRIKIDGALNDQNIDLDQDAFWKLGQFYVNKNDPSIFVEKRFGVGWTCNWAHPLSWLFLIGVIAIPVLVSLLFI